MHNFKNRKTQELYNYLVDDFDWNAFTYGQSYVLKSFGGYIEKFKEEDWCYFEKNIDLWASEILHRFAVVIVEYYSKNLNPAIQKRVYCLALINCWDTETCDLCNNLPAELGLVVDLDVKILERIIERLEQLLNHYTVVAHFQAEEHTKHTIEFVKKKLNITLEHNNANNV